MRKFITLAYFQIHVNIIGLPVFLVNKAIVFEKRCSKFGLKENNMKLYSYLITQNE